MAVHYISPFSITKNIGGAINAAVEQLSPIDEDWIVLTDHDVMFLLPDSKKQLEEILNTTQLDILAPMTNRLAMPYQLVSGMFDEYDIREHIKKATLVSALNYGEVFETRELLAAMVLCFRYSTYKNLGGFAEHSISFDSMFCARAINANMRLGIMTGIYLFHLYRMWGDVEAKNNYLHLLP